MDSRVSLVARRSGLCLVALFTACSPEPIDGAETPAAVNAGAAGTGGAAGTATLSAGASGGIDAGAAGSALTGGAGGMAGVANGGVAGGAAAAGAAGFPSGSGGSGGAAQSGGAGGMLPNGGAAGGSSTGELPAATIWIAGDSTVKTYAAGNTDGNNGTSLEGWGQELGSFFTSKVTINNQAVGGRSVAFFMWSVATDSAGAYQCVDDQGTPSFKLSGGNKVDTAQWAAIKKGMKPGDFLLVQFGHNDETHTCPRFVSTADYATHLGFMADTAKALGATPIFVTPMGHRSFSGAKFNNTLLPYANSMKAQAKAQTLELIDLNLRSGEYYERVGNAYLTSNIFDGGSTHFIKAGAIQMASLIVGEIKKNDQRLAKYLK